MSKSLIQILLVEDDELFRLGLNTRLSQETDFQVVTEVGDGEAAMTLVRDRDFDLVLLDIGLPGVGGVEVCRSMVQIRPGIPVLALTSHQSPTLIAHLIEAGARGYCIKGAPSETLVLAMRSIVAGGTWWDAIASQHIQSVFQTLKPVATPQENSVLHRLTEREQEILAWVAAGKSNQEIAETLFITPGTVRVHIHAILHKLQVRDRTQAAIYALQHGLIQPPHPGSPADA